MEFGLSKKRKSVRSCPEKEGWLFKNLPGPGFVPFLITHFTATFRASY